MHRKTTGLKPTDTIQFIMTGMKARSYQLKLIAGNLDHGGLTGYLQDSYLNTSIPIDLRDTTTTVNFTITDIAGSQNPERFRIVFKEFTVLPITLITLNATRQVDEVKLTWNLKSEINLQKFEVEDLSTVAGLKN